MVAFRCYLADGKDLIQEWYDSVDGSVCGVVDAVVEELQDMPRHLWRRKPFANLSRPACLGLAEIRLEVDGEHYRILGIDGPGPDEFTLLYPFRKDDDPRYLEACLAAQKRRELVENDADRSRPCVFP